jgi:hypothetical protein
MQVAQRSVRERPVNAASGTSYSVWQFGQDKRMIIVGMTLLPAPRNKMIYFARGRPANPARHGFRGKPAPRRLPVTA